MRHAAAIDVSLHNQYRNMDGNTIVILLHFLSNKNQHAKDSVWSSIKQKLIRFINDGLRKFVGF